MVIKGKVLNKKTSTVPPEAIYIGRPSILGNPFVIGRHGTREEVISKFERYARDRLKKDAAFRKAILDCYGKALACFCHPERCHGDIILLMAAEVHAQHMRHVAFAKKMESL